MSEHQDVNKVKKQRICQLSVNSDNNNNDNSDNSDNNNNNNFFFKTNTWGLPWWRSGYDSVLPMQGARVRSLVQELGPTCRN